MFDQLSERLQSSFQQLSGKSQLSLENMDDAIKEVRRALLEADVSLRVVKDFIVKVREKAEGQNVVQSVSPSQQLIKIVNDELVEILGGENKPINLQGNPALVLLFGLQGAGKTTTAAKLALHLRKKEKLNPLLVACDVYRPAAQQQLVTLGKQIQVEVFHLPDEKNVSTIAKQAIDYAKANNLHPVIIDTAGRTQVDTEMMAELLLLERQLSPQEKLLVVDGMMGQEAITVAETFNTQLSLTGLILTKLDGDSRGGAALSLVNVTQQPIKFIGVSEKPDGLEPFYPDRLASRILGMGDVVGLVEKAQEAIDLKEAEAMEKRLRKAQFTLEDFMQIQNMIKKLGSLEGILGMLPIPGLNKDLKQMISHTGESEMKKAQAMINSMTIKERQNPELIKSTRLNRIAKGCGKSEQDIKQFLQQFEMMRQMMKQMGQFMPGGMGGGPSGGGKKPKHPMLMMPRQKRPRF